MTVNHISKSDRFQLVFYGLLIAGIAVTGVWTLVDKANGPPAAESPVTQVASSARGGAATTVPERLAAVPAQSLWATVKYRDTPVDLNAMSAIPIVPSGDLVAAWYDVVNAYLVVDLNSTLYHYCAFSLDDASALAEADRAGDHYRSSIRGDFDCRTQGRVPEYG